MKKIIKKAISAVISTAMISSLCISAYAVSAVTSSVDTIMNEDFESVTLVSEIEDVSEIGTGGVSIVADSARGNVLAIKGGVSGSKYGIQKEFTATTEEITISFMSKVGESQRLDVMAESSNGTQDWLFRWNPGNKWAISSGAGEYTMHWGDALDKDAWYKTVVTVKPNGKTTGTVYDLSGNIIVPTREGSTNLADIKKIMFRDNDKSTAYNYVDNIVITKPGPAWLDEDFEGYTSIGDWNDVIQIGTGGLSLVQDASSERGQVLAIGNTTGKHGFSREFVATTEEVTISFWSKIGASQRLDIMAESSNGAQDWLFRWNPNNKWAISSGTGEFTMHWGDELIRGAWYRTIVTVKANGKTTGTVYDANGNVIVPTREGSTNLADVKKILFRNNDTASDCNYVDDIIISQAGYVSERVFLNETFEGDTFAFTPSNNFAIEEMNGSKVAVLNYGSGSVNMNADVKDIFSGTVKISYNLYLNGATGYITSKDNNNKWYALLYVSDRRLYHSKATVLTDNLIYQGNSNENVWVNVENIVDLDKKVNRIKVYSMDGELLSSATDEVFNCADDDNVTIPNITTIDVRNWSKTAEKFICIDDFRVETVAPSVDVAGVTMTDIFGNTIVGLSNITPAVKTISVAFSEDMSANNQQSLISLKDEDRNIPAFSTAFSGNECIITLENGLNAEKTYTLKLSEKLASTTGLTIGKSYTTQFNTKQPEKTEVVATAHKNGSKIDIDASYINAGIANLPLVYIMAFYNEDKELVDVKILSEAQATGICGKVAHQFDDYEGDDTVNRVQFMVWDGLQTINPYIAPIIVE